MLYIFNQIFCDLCIFKIVYIYLLIVFNRTFVITYLKYYVIFYNKYSAVKKIMKIMFIFFILFWNNFEIIIFKYVEHI